jgi:hypothetical protein
MGNSSLGGIYYPVNRVSSVDIPLDTKSLKGDMAVGLAG